jgi:hypothetical protein
MLDGRIMAKALDALALPPQAPSAGLPPRLDLQALSEGQPLRREHQPCLRSQPRRSGRFSTFLRGAGYVHHLAVVQKGLDADLEAVNNQASGFGCDTRVRKSLLLPSFVRFEEQAQGAQS